MNRRAPVLALLALAAALGGCGGDSPRDVVADTADKLAEVRSGALRMRVEMRPDRLREPGIAVSLTGPFSLPRGRELPTARFSYARTLGDQRAAGTLVSTPTAAWVAVNGVFYRLPAEVAAQLRGGQGGISAGKLHVTDWIEQPTLEDAGDLQRVRGRLDLAAALRDMGAASQAAGGPLGELARLDERRLRAAVRSSSVELVTGREDRFLRSLRATAVLDVPPELRRRVRGSGLRLAFDLALARVNQPVVVRPPPSAQPLPSGAGR